jgi:hypothetical protein
MAHAIDQLGSTKFLATAPERLDYFERKRKIDPQTAEIKLGLAAQLGRPAD